MNRDSFQKTWQTEAPGSQARNKKLIYLFPGGLLLFLVGSVVIGAAFGGNVDDYTILETAIGNLPLWSAFGLVAFFWAGREYLSLLKLKLKWLDVPAGLAIGVAAQFAVGLLYWILSPVIDTDEVSESAEELIDKVDGWPDILVFTIFVVVLAPFFEEIFFRGFLQSLLGGRGAAILVTATAFTLIHIEYLLFLGLFFIAIVLGLLVKYTGRLGMALFAHIGFNAVAFIFNL